MFTGNNFKVLRSQPDPNLANEHGNTPLHYASFWNYIGICEVCMITIATLSDII